MVKIGSYELTGNGSINFESSEINGVALPADYIEFMQQNNGGEGDIGDTWVVLYDKDMLLECNSDGSLEEDERFSRAVLIGGNGGGEWFGIDSEGNYFLTPSVGDGEDTKVLGRTLLDFLVGLNEYFS